MIVGNNMTNISYLTQVLDSKFSIKDLGNLKYFIGFEIIISSTGVSICQQKYSLDLLLEAGLLRAKPAPNPMDPSHKIILDSVPPLLSNPTYFYNLIGKLLYLTHIRPDISYVVCRLI